MKNMTTSTSRNPGPFKSIWKNKCFSRIFIPAVLIFLSLPISAMAVVETFVLDFNDIQIRGHQGEGATILLKKSLKEQYPWLDVSHLELQNVVLVAKSKMGRGGAELRVGNRVTTMSEIGGHPGQFHNSDRSSFDRIRFWNPSQNSQGQWQIGLRGNLIVRKVVLMVENHSPGHHHKKGRRNNW